MSIHPLENIALYNHIAMRKGYIFFYLFVCNLQVALRLRLEVGSFERDISGWCTINMMYSGPLFHVVLQSSVTFERQVGFRIANTTAIEL